jgi:hypothetical protein
MPTHEIYFDIRIKVEVQDHDDEDAAIDYAETQVTNYMSELPENIEMESCDMDDVEIVDE